MLLRRPQRHLCGSHAHSAQCRHRNGARRENGEAPFAGGVSESSSQGRARGRECVPGKGGREFAESEEEEEGHCGLSTVRKGAAVTVSPGRRAGAWSGKALWEATPNPGFLISTVRV